MGENDYRNRSGDILIVNGRVIAGHHLRCNLFIAKL